MTKKADSKKKDVKSKVIVKKGKRVVPATSEKAKKTNGPKLKVPRYGFGRTSQGSKVAHILLKPAAKENEGVLLCQFGRNKKQYEVNEHITIDILNCKNCLASDMAKMLKEEAAELERKAKAETKEAAKRRVAKKRRTDEEAKEAATIPPDSVMVIYAMNKSGDPILTVVPENNEKDGIEAAKQKIDDTLSQNKGKYKRWERAGKAFRSKYVTFAELEGYIGSTEQVFHSTMKGSGDQLMALLGAILAELRDIKRNTSFTAKNTRQFGGRSVIPRKQYHPSDQNNRKEDRRVIPRRG